MKFCFRPFFHLFFIGFSLSNFLLSPPVDAANETPFVTIIIHEILSDPASNGHGFVELKNMSLLSVDLTDWYLTNADGTKYIIEHPTPLDSQTLLSLTTNLVLRNEGDTLRLFDTNDLLQDEIIIPGSVTDKSYSRFVNNPGYPQDSVWEWSEPSPGTDNVRTVLTVTADPAGGTYAAPVSVTLQANKREAKIFYAYSGDATPDEQWEYTAPLRIEQSTELWFFAFTDSNDRTPIHTENYFFESTAIESTILINEIYPSSSTNQSAWVELYNRGEGEMNLAGYSLINSAGQKYILSQTTLPAGKMLPLYFSPLNLQLNAEGDTLKFYSPENTLLDIATYGEIASNQSMVRLYDSDTSYFFVNTTAPTPGATNTYARTVAVKPTPPKKIPLTPTAPTYYEPTVIPALPEPIPPVNENRNAVSNGNMNTAPAALPLTPPATNENANAAAAEWNTNANTPIPAFNENQNLAPLPLPVPPPSSPSPPLQPDITSASSATPGDLPLMAVLSGAFVILAVLGYFLFAKKKA